MFQDQLLGLVLADFEFKSEEDQTKFSPPEFCLAEVTQEKFIAGGFLAGKSYEEIKDKLAQYNYQKL